MATASDLFYSILSLDAYNRGYGKGMLGADGSQQIGTATVSKESTNIAGSEAASFYAVSYNWNGQTVISYRGTRFPGAPDYGDVKNGWTLSGGYAQASQAQMN